MSFCSRERSGGGGGGGWRFWGASAGCHGHQSHPAGAAELRVTWRDQRGHNKREQRTEHSQPGHHIRLLGHGFLVQDGLRIDLSGLCRYSDQAHRLKMRTVVANPNFAEAVQNVPANGRPESAAPVMGARTIGAQPSARSQRSPPADLMLALGRFRKHASTGCCQLSRSERGQQRPTPEPF
jgi:hypothetical protein